MYKETIQHYSNINRGQFPLGEDRYLSLASRKPRLLFDENDPHSGVIEAFNKVFLDNQVIVDARKASYDRVRRRQNFIKRRLPLKGNDLSDANLFHFEYGNFGYVVSIGSLEFPNDYLHVIQIAKYKELSYYRLELEVRDFGDEGSERGDADICYRLYSSYDNFQYAKPTLKAQNTRSTIQVALKLLSNLQHRDIGVDYSFSYT